jgi:hypothetical protein
MRLGETNRTFFLVLLLLVGIPEMSGCAKKSLIADETMIRCQAVNIPCYKKSDYERLLNSNNDEVRYNAICNLVPYAREYAKAAMKNQPEDTPAKGPSETEDRAKVEKHVFDVISSQLNSQNESIKAASLVFIDEFSAEYQDKGRLWTLVVNVKTRNIRTQYEQLRILTKLCDSEQQIAPELINGFLDSRSWLIKSMTYVLLGSIASDNFHKRLIAEYRRAKEEFDKILIIHAFSKGFGADVFALLTEELVATENARIREHCAGVLKMYRDETAVSEWLVANHKLIDDDTLKAILAGYYCDLASPKGRSFFVRVLRSGQERVIGLIDQELFFQELYEGLANQESADNLGEVEAAVAGLDSLGKSWIEYREKRGEEERKRKAKSDREEHFKRDLLPKYNAKLEAFIRETEKLLADGGMEQDEVKEVTEAMRELLRLLRQDESR